MSHVDVRSLLLGLGRRGLVSLDVLAFDGADQAVQQRVLGPALTARPRRAAREMGVR
jgi:hypothetical protein